jgi:hypothetical protein
VSVHIQDVLARIAQISSGFTGADAANEAGGHRLPFPVCLRLSITTDVERTELDYLNRFGHGATVYFSLKDYDHGRQLAKELFTAVSGKEPDMSIYNGSGFAPDDKLYLFVHIEHPKAVQTYAC